ncbi:MAG TPA: M17 family peptidase N-terminal domain-containing protein [Polyangiaceae bacterium]|nr:M17 family peptidase N-terminal domain-containing protein [Polyangiaceae bacterium]
MDLRFIQPDLRRLDLSGTEVLVAPLTRDERPPRGLAGLIDWRLAGRVSALLLDGFASGELGEVLLVPGKPKLPFEKLVFFGIGSSSAFGEPVFRAIVEKMLRTLEGLCARTAVVQLPGRHFDAIAPERAADILLECAGGRQEHDVWTLVEPQEAQRAITAHMVQERRRIRSL